MRFVLIGVCSVLLLSGCQDRVIWQDNGQIEGSSEEREVWDDNGEVDDATENREVWDSNGQMDTGDRKIWNDSGGEPVVE